MFGEVVDHTDSSEPAVVGDECEEGMKGRFVLVQRDTKGIIGDMNFNNVIVNHTDQGKSQLFIYNMHSVYLFV